MASQKPVIHGRDHLPGGADPIIATELSGIQFGGDNRVYGADNQGGYLSITTNEQEGVTGLGISLVDDGAGGILVNSGSGGDLTLAAANGGDIHIDNSSADIDIAANADISVQAGAELDLSTIVGAVMVEAGGPARHHTINDGDAHVVGAAVARLESQGGHDSVPGGVNIQSLGGAGIEINAKSTSGAGFPAGGTRPIVINSSGSEGGTTGPTVVVGIADGDLFEIFRNDTFASLMSVSTAGVQMHTLPTSNPGGSGLLWNSAGTVKIT